MKGTKRLLIVLLSLMMVFTTMPASFGMAFAEDGTGEGLVDVQEEIQDNADLDQPTGDAAADETAEPPTDTVTAENAEPAADAEAAEPAPEEVIEEVLPETGASYAVNEEAEALVVHGKATESKAAAKQALVEEGLTDEEADRLAGMLFEAKDANDQNGEGEDGGEGEVRNNAADGSSIDGIRVEWIVNDQAYDNSLLTVTPTNDADQMVKARVWFELSGESNYAPGSITITIPAYIFKDRFNTDYGTIVIPFAEDPSKKDEFNWKLDTNEDGEPVYILTNTRTFQSASEAFFEIIFAKLTPHNLVDMQESDPFNALIEVTTKNTTISLESNDITARFDTSSKVEKVTKRAYGKPEIISASSVPSDLRVSGEDRYLKIVWYITVLNKANTYYYLDLKDWIPDEHEGILISATANDPQVYVKDGVYYGYQTDKLLTFTVTTAYPFSQFEPDVDYTFNNDIEFTNRQKDPTTDQPTTAAAHATTTWHYTDPQHLEPDGHYMIFKNGNDDTAAGNLTHKITDKERTTNDLHMWDRNLEGWFGSYPSALNEMQDVYAEKGEDGQIRLSYTMDSVGYTMPWMFDDESVKGPDGNRAAWNIANYSRPVTMVTQDYGLRINRKGDAMVVHDEFEYLSVEFPGAPYVYRGKPNRINEDGTWYAQNYRDGTFLYTPDSDQANWPDIDLELLIDGTWQKYATASWKSGSFIATLSDGTTQTNRVIDFSQLAGQVDSVRTVVTMQNSATEGTTTQAGISYDIRLVTALKTTDKIMKIIGDEFDKTSAPQLYIWNRSNLTAFYPDGVREYDDDPIVSLGTEEYNYDDMIQNKDGYDTLSGYSTDLQIFPTKESSFDVTEIDYNTGYMIVHYKASVEERSYIHSKKTYVEAIADGRIIEETSGVWRDLLPEGMTPVLEDENGNCAIKVRDNDLITGIELNDVPGTNRKMLEVYVDLKNTPTAVQLSGSNQPYYSDILTIEFDAMLSLEQADILNYFDEGNAPHNVISFESSNEVIGTVDGYCGEPDKPVGNNVATKDAFKTQEEKDLMTNLDPDRDTPSFVYAGTDTPLVKLAKGVAGLHKDVEVNGDNEWSQGTYYGDPSNARTVFIGGKYRYRLKYSPEDKTSAEDIILYDSIENFYAQEGNDEVDIKAPRWQGTFNGVDTGKLEEKGIKPIVYYSTKQLDLFIEDPDPTQPGTPIHRDFSELDDEGNPIWVEASRFTGDLSEVHMVAIDCTWMDEARTQKFHLETGEYVIAYINMIAPDLEEVYREGYLKEVGPWGDSAQAYNNASEMTTLIDDVSGAAQENFSVTSDYTKVGLKPYDISVRKVWDDDDDRDGYRTESVTITLYADGQDTGRTLILDEKNDWKGTFDNLTYADSDGNKINYSIKETPVPDEYHAGYALTDVSKVNYVVTNRHEPEVVNKEGMKTWKDDEEAYRPEYITIRLYRSVFPYETETVYKTITVRPNGQGYWAYSFTNLPKNEDGKEIHYRVEEKPEGKIESYAITYDGDDIINTYHPYGDLTVEKEIVNATAAASGKTFTFNFYFTDPDDGLPVMAKYNYDIIDLTTGVATPSGTVEYGSQVTISADQKIYVHDIDEYVDYEVTEENTPGFTMTKHTGDKGVVYPNRTAEAKFTNTYASEGRLELKARKVLKNHELKKYQFHFEVYRVEADGTETLIRTTSSLDQDQVSYDTDGTVISSGAPVSFGVIKFTDAVDGQTFKYIIKEQIPEDVDENLKSKGYIYDPTEYKITVRMDDDGEGHMVPTYFDEDGNVTDPPETALFNEDFIFTNTYEVDGKIQLRVWKELKGRKIEPKEFSFELLDSEGNPILDEDGNPIIAFNDENGVVVFPEIKYDQKDIGKTYYYGFREIPGNDPAVIYDDSVYGYKVTVSDNDDGTMSIDMDKAAPAITRDEDGNIETIDWTNWTTEGAGLPVFVNPVKPGNLAVTKLISDDSEEYDPNQMFHFYVKLIGEDIPEGKLDYEITKVGQDDPAPGQDDPGDDTAGGEESAEEEPDGPGENADRNAAPFEGNGEGAAYHAGNSGNRFLGLLGKFFRAITDTAYAADDDIAGGTYDGVDWRITADGELIIGKEGETQTYTNRTSRVQTSWPWNDYRLQIKSARFEGTVKGNGSHTSMFFGNRNMTTIDLNGFDTSAVTAFSSMFRECHALKEIDLSMLDTSSLTNTSYMFDMAGTGNATNALSSSSVLTTIKFGENFDVSHVKGMARMFQACNMLKNLDIGGFDTSSATDMAWMFAGCSSLKNIDVAGWDTSNVENMQRMFSQVGASTIPLGNFNTSKVTNMISMFESSGSLTYLDVTGWDTSNVTSLYHTFRWTGKLVVDLKNWKTPKVTTIELLFQGNSGITSLDLSGWDTSNITNMFGAFASTVNLKTIDVSTWNVEKVTGMSKLFQDSGIEAVDFSNWKTTNCTGQNGIVESCANLKELDLGNWDTRKATDLNEFCWYDYELRRVNLGPNVHLKVGSTSLVLPVPKTDYGMWIREDEMFGPWTPSEMVQNYDPETMNGVWIWYDPVNYTINFTADEDVQGSMASVTPDAKEDYTLPANKFFKPNYVFDHWDVVKVEEVKAGTTYEDRETIPAKTYAAGTKVTLKAVLKERQTTANVVDGQFDLWLYGGEMATFTDLPAGTAYEVWEETPDGWVLVKVVDASGIIQPLETANAVFTNKYQPDITTVQFLGTKLMDNKAAEKDEFRFVMTEKGNTNGTITIINENGEEEEATLPITVSTLDGGLIQFPAIVYTKEDVGTHTYTIVEVDPEDENIDWDTHKETVTVLVNEYEDGTLSAKKNYDTDGIKFINKTSPGSLKITKEGGPVTKDNQDDEFTVRITLHNENGQPIGDDEGIYWYKVDENGDIIDDGTQPNNPGRKSSSWDSFKTWASDTWEDIKGVFTEPLVETAYGAENDERSFEGMAYAVLTADGELIFFRSTEQYEPRVDGTFTDILGNTYTGKVYGGYQYGGLEAWTGYFVNNRSRNWYSELDNIKRVRVADGQGIRPQSQMAEWFRSADNVTDIDLTGFDTSNVTSMDHLFSYCTSLENLNFSTLDTSKVTKMSGLFQSCRKLASIDLSTLNTMRVTDMSSMFEDCRSLTEIDLSPLDTSRVTTMYALFKDCFNLTSVNFTGLDTSRVTQMGSMFRNCTSLETLDVSPLDTSSVTNMNYMFGSDRQVNYTVVPMSLKTLDVSGFETGNVTNMSYMFSNCRNMTEIDVSGFDTGKVTNMADMFNQCRELTTIDVSGFETGNVTNMSYMFNLCVKVTDLDVSGFETGKVTDMSYMFNYCSSLTELDVSGFDTGNVTNMAGTFRFCSGLTKLDVSGFDTGKVTNFGTVRGSNNMDTAAGGTFYGCSGLTELDVSNFNTGSARYMGGMFGKCSSLTSLDLSSFETEKVEDMAGMFYECTNLEYLDIRNFNSASCTRQATMDRMFSGDKKLSTIELGPDFKFALASSQNPCLLDPPITDVYTGYWTRIDGMYRTTARNLDTLGRLYNTNPEAMQGTWVWEVKNSRGIVRFDGNRGFTSQDDIIATSATQPITMPTADTTVFPEHTLIGWNTDPYGLGTQYEPGETYTDIVKLGAYVTLYAQWEGENEVTCLVRHYKQNTDLSTYSLAETTAVYGKPGDSVTPDTKNYQGFITPEKQTVILGSRAANMEVSYYYDRITYEIIYDGNGATSGTMEPMTMLWGIADSVPRCGYSKEGSLFTEWNTEPDGSGTSYNVGQSIVNIPGFETGEVTLYAQWFDIPYDPVTPTDGAITLTFKVGETIVIPDLPAGTTYTIEELSGPDYMPKGWTQKGIIGADGTILSNITNEATVTNTYTAEGQAILKATKIFEGGELSEGQFTFELWREIKGFKPQLLQTKTNNAPVEAGNTAEVVFDPINYTAKDAGETYTYYIKEVPAAGDNTVLYDYHYEYATVTVTDVGGVLDVKVEYDEDGAVFINTPGRGHLKITKAVMPGSPEKADFEFLIELFDKDGNELEGDYPLYTENFKIPVASGDRINISAGQTVRVGNLPDGTTYKVTEIDKAGWTLVDSENVEGTIVAGETAEAVFRNEFMTEISIAPEADKTLIGKDLTEGQFEFGIYDEDEVMVSAGKNDADGHITFSPIYYTSYDAGKTFYYTVAEIDGFERGIDYDEKVYNITVTVTEDEEGVLTAKLSDNAKKMTFTNTYMSTGKVTFEGTKTIEGRELKDGDVFTFEVKENGTNNVWTAVSDSTGKINYPVIYYTYDPANKIDDTGTHVYKVRETSTNGNGITVDTNDYTVIVEVTEKGTGILEVKSKDNYKALDFINTYEAEGDITFEGQKTITGREMTADDIFEFQMVDDKTGNIWNFKNDADGKINYPKLSYTLADLGEHSYTVKEISKADPDKGLGVDSTEYKVTVTVTDNGNGTLNVAGSDNAKALNFVNPYDANGEITFVGSKSVEGREMLDDDKFDFTLYGEDGKVIETVQNDGSVFKFSPIKYNLLDHGKEFKYTVKETSTAAKGVGVDATVYHITVTVTDTGNGKLEVVSKTDEGPDTEHLVFVNPYDASGSITFEGTKTLKGRALTKKDVFSFSVSETGTDNVWTATNDENGKISYPEITYGLADVGTHTYTVRETSKTGNNITVDNKVYTVTVKVSDNKDGTLKVEADKECKALNFINTYEPPEEPKTGDTTNVMGYAFALTASLLALLILFRRRKTNE